ncbi:MAG: replicative DNA helicase [Bacteroidales bacterium]|nr:replicative DNA helicase [Bacteroidales bacterium]
MPSQKTGGKKTDRKRDLENLGLEVGNKPPQALDVEESVLGALLLDQSSQNLALSELTKNCFYDPRHQMIFEAIQALSAEHSAIDIVTVSDKLRKQGNLEAVGGAVVLSGLSEKVGAASHLEFYIKILKQKAIQRDLISASYDILRDSFDESIDVDDLVDAAQTKVFDAIQSNVRREVQAIGNVIEVVIREIEGQQSQTGLSGVPSGFVSIDRVTQGWQPSDLIIIAARPSVGKTAFALNIARNAAVDHHKPVAFFSLEMSSKQLAKRLMVSETGLSAEKIKGALKLEDYEWQQLDYRIKNLSSAPLYIDDTPSLPVMEFRTKAKNLVKNKGVQLIVVDYLQLMQAPEQAKGGLREQEVAYISRTLKATAKELDIPIIALSQLSRNSVQRQGSGGKPMLSDLRESGSIEQDADMVIFIHRPDYIGLSDNPEDKEKTQIIIAKHRNGETLDLDMVFKSEQVRFMEPEDALDVYAQRPIQSSINREEFE